MKLSTEILNKAIYNTDRKEFHLSQAEDYSPGDTDSEPLELCWVSLQNGAYKGKIGKVT